MNLQTLTPWLLAGGLVASLGWNLLHTGTGSRSPERGPVDTGKGAALTCAPAENLACAGADCQLAIDLDLGLDASEMRTLGEVCAASCDRSRELDTRAERALAELWRGVANPDLDPAAIDELLERVLELRARSLKTCVEGALTVRDALPADRARALFEGCCSPESGESEARAE